MGELVPFFGKEVAQHREVCICFNKLQLVPGTVRWAWSASVKQKQSSKVSKSCSGK